MALLTLIGAFFHYVLLKIMSLDERGAAGQYQTGKGTEKTEGQQQRTVNATPEERELNAMNLEMRRAAQPQLMNLQDLNLSLAGDMVQGGELPGYFNRIPEGISPEVTQSLVNNSLMDVATNAQMGGILDSGVAQELGMNAASNIRNQAEQYNINNLMQLLGLGVDASNTLQAPTYNYNQSLSQMLSGNRGETMQTTGRADTNTSSRQHSWNILGSVSDSRLKDDIKYVTDGELKFATWVWNDKAEQLYGLKGKDSGYIAQDVQKLYPEAVHTDDNGYLRINYNLLADKKIA